MCFLFCCHRTEAALLGHFRLSQEMDNQANIFAVVSKKKEEVRASSVQDLLSETLKYNRKKMRNLSLSASYLNELY